MRKKREGRKQPVSKLALLGSAMCALSLALSGCQNSAQTEEEIVIPKQENEEAKVPPEGTEMEGEMQEVAAGAVEGAIAEQVQAPESYQWEGGDEVVSVKVDAPVILPEGEGFKTWKVSSRAFTQEDYDKVSAVLLGGAALWNRDEELMAKAYISRF